MKDDKWILDDSDIDVIPGNLDRREFMKLLGGGIVIFFAVDDPSLAQQRRRGQGYPEDFNAYLKIGEDGRAACFTGKTYPWNLWTWSWGTQPSAPMTAVLSAHEAPSISARPCGRLRPRPG